MNHIFHYYVTYFLAKKNGFNDEDCETLAYSAQYVDHAIVPYRVRLANGDVYDSGTTHHFGFWDKSQEHEIWMPFHFFPSGLPESQIPEANLRKDRHWSSDIVVPHSSAARKVLIAALKSRNLYRVGVALHMWADTWAHQNFSGRRDDLNKVPGALPLPPIGHAQAESVPDKFSVEWTDSRLLSPRVSNRERFIEAALSIHKYLATFQGRSFENGPAVISELGAILGPAYAGASIGLHRGIQKSIREQVGRIKNAFSDTRDRNDTFETIRSGLLDEEIELNFRIALGIEGYDRHSWRRDAFRQSTFDEPEETNDKALWLRSEVFSRTAQAGIEVVAKPDFASSDYFNWCEAAKEHRSVAHRVIRSLVAGDTA